MADWKKLAENALYAQSACNLSGIVHSFSRDVTQVREKLREEGKEDTEDVNEHPVCVLYAAQILYLSGGGLYPSEEYRKAYEWAQENK